MATHIKTIVDNDGNTILPRTRSNAVVMVDGSLNLDDQIQALKTGKADKSTTYTKTENDTALALKADKSTTYTKTEVDTKDGLKADKLSTYTKTENDTAMALKADKSNTYTKTEVDTKDALKADKVQEAWITPTLLNGWVHHTPLGAPSAPVAYYKDTLGIVRLRGYVKSGVDGTTVFELPLGYRPNKNESFVTAMPNTNFAIVNISITGSVTFHLRASGCLSGVTFKAEV